MPIVQCPGCNAPLSEGAACSVCGRRAGDQSSPEPGITFLDDAAPHSAPLASPATSEPPVLVIPREPPAANEPPTPVSDSPVDLLSSLAAPPLRSPPVLEIVSPAPSREPAPSVELVITEDLVITEQSAAEPVPGFCSRCGNALVAGVQCPRCRTGTPPTAYSPFAPYGYGYAYGNAGRPQYAYASPYGLVGSGPYGWMPYYAYPPPSTFSAAPLISLLGIFFAMMGIHLVMGVAIASGAPAIPSMLTAEAVDALLVIVWCAFLRSDIGPTLTTSVGPLWLPAGIACGAVTFGVATAFMMFLTQVLRLEEIKLNDDFVRAGYGWWVIVAAIAVQPAIIEELAFRGVIQSGLEKLTTPTTAILCSAAMFAFIHLSWPSFPHLFLMGLALGWLRWKTGSLYPSMLLHFTHNFLCVITES